MLYIIGIHHDIRLGSKITFENYVAYVLDTEKLTVSVKPAVEFMRYLLFDLGMAKFSDEPILDIQCPYTGKQKAICKDYAIPNKLSVVQGIDAIEGIIYGPDKIFYPTAYRHSYDTDIKGFYYNLGGGYIRFLDKYYKCNFELGDLMCTSDSIGVTCPDLREQCHTMRLCEYSLFGISEVKINIENFGKFVLYGNETKFATNPDGSAIMGIVEVRPREALLSCTKGCKV